MRTLALILLGFSSGWFSCVTLSAYMERIFDWRRPAIPAVLAALFIVIILICTP